MVLAEIVRRCRRWPLVLAVAGLCLAGAGCGSGSSGPATPPTAPASATTPASPTAATGPPATDAPSADVLQYVALGDSLASGMGGEASYADFYRRGLQQRTGRHVELTNLGRPGWTSAQLLDALRTSEGFRDTVAAADVVTWDIGGNDVVQAVIRSATGTCGGGDGLRCVRRTAAGFAGRWEAIVDELLALRRSEDVALRTFDLYTPFIPPDARTDQVLTQLQAMNATITASHGHDGIAVAQVAAAFAGSFDELIDDDGLHPSRAGHEFIAELLLALDGPPDG